MDNIKEELSGIKTELNEMNKTLVRNTTSLELHMARTEASETRLSRVENWLVGLLVSVLVALLGVLIKLSI